MKRLLLHGFAGGRDGFPPLEAITPDLPGHGSAPDATSWDDAVQALAELVDRDTALIGYSMGARLALAVALRKPPAHLVLESGTAGIEDAAERDKRRAEDERLAQMTERSFDEFLTTWEDHPTLAALKPFAAKLRAERMRHRPAGLASALRALGTGSQPSYWHELRDLRAPVTLIAGALDAKFAAIARRMHSLLPDSTLHLIDEAGHAPHLERPHHYLGALP